MMAWRNWALAGMLGLAAGCGNVSATFGPTPGVAPVITRLVVLPESGLRGSRAVELLGCASGTGRLDFEWHANAGVISIATASALATDSWPVSVYTAWSPPGMPGSYDVTLRVSDASSASTRASMHFVADRTGLRQVRDPFSEYGVPCGPL